MLKTRGSRELQKLLAVDTAQTPAPINAKSIVPADSQRILVVDSLTEAEKPTKKRRAGAAGSPNTFE
jgi:hypothetical protein